MRSGLQLERARIHEKLATLVYDTIPDPGGRLTAAAAKHDDAHQQLSRAVALGRVDLTTRRARNRLRKLKGLMRMLDKTDHVCASEVPCREERHRLIDPVLADLEKLAKQTHHARRERPPITPTKETPMIERCVVEGHPHHRAGCILEGPRTEPARPATNGHAPADLPEVVGLHLTAFESALRVPTTQPVRLHRAEELARAVLTFPPDAQRRMVASLFFRLATRSGR
jgi:hypothetical protein